MYRYIRRFSALLGFCTLKAKINRLRFRPVATTPHVLSVIVLMDICSH